MEFDARLRASFVPRRKDHRDRDSLIRTRVLESASDVSGQYGADDAPAAQAAINAKLGGPQDCVDGYYRRLTARVELGVSADAARAAAQRRQDDARVARLRYLRSVLYTDPSLLLIEHFDRNPSASMAPEVLVQKYQALANQLREAEEWWSPLMVAWSELATQTAGSSDDVIVAMKALLAAINELDGRLAARHSLPSTLPDGG